MNKRSRISVAIAAALLLALGSGYTIGMQQHAEDQAGVGSIKVSYAFDVNDKRKLMKYGNEVFVAEVLHVARTDAKASTTVWRVKVIKSIKGSRSGEVLVRQLGYVDANKKAHVVEDQDLLVPGTRRLLVTTRTADADVNTLVGGAASVADVASPARERLVVAEYAKALRDAK